MKIHPLSPALYLAGVFILILTLFGYLIDYELFDPLIAIILYLVLNEGSKFIAEYTMKDE